MPERGGARLSPWHLLCSGAQTPVGRWRNLLVVMVAWIVLYWLNDWLFYALMVSDQVNWIFLPAALRMLAVLLCGWIGALGVFIGSLLTGLYGSPDTDLMTSFHLAGLSAVSPMIALLATGWLFRVDVNLTGMTSTQLLGLSAIAAVCAAVFHNLGFLWLDLSTHFFASLLPMFVGDLVGTLLVLYIARWIISIALARRRWTL